LSSYRSRPLQGRQVKDKQVIEPVLSITATEDKHHVFNDASCVELAHWCLAPNDAWNVEGEFLHSFLQVDEYHIRENLETIPSSVDNYLGSVPELTRVTHARLWQLVLVDFWLAPKLFL